MLASIYQHDVKLQLYSLCEVRMAPVKLAPLETPGERYDVGKAADPEPASNEPDARARDNDQGTAADPKEVAAPASNNPAACVRDDAGKAAVHTADPAVVAGAGATANADLFFDAVSEEQRTRLQFCSADFYFSENAIKPHVSVIRTGPLDKRVSVRFRVADVLHDGLRSSASIGDDFILEPGTLTFEPGEAHKEIPFNMVDDSAWEPMEFFRVEVSSKL